MSGQHHDLTFTDRFGITDPLKAKFRHGRPGEVAPHAEFSDKPLWNHDRQRVEGCRISTDRENNHYRQEWYDRATGEITWGPKDGELDDPDMHGKSARRPRDT